MMQAIGTIAAPLHRKMEESLRRRQRLQDLNPTITCLHCWDEGEVDFSTGRIPCPVCEKGTSIEREREQRAWLERVGAECGIPASFLADSTRSVGPSESHVRSILESVGRNLGAYLHGGVRVGKSTIAVRVLRHVVEKHDPTPGSPGRIGYFTTTSDYLQSIRDSFDSQGAGSSGVADGRGGSHQFSRLRRTRLLVLDDISVERLTEWGCEQIQALVDHRVSNGLVTIYTSNLSPNNLEERINRTRDKSTRNTLYPAGSRIVSRILGSCEVVRVDGPDYRRKAT